MSILISGRDGPTLGLFCSADMFEKLKFESARLRKSWRPFDAFNFLVTGWHLHHDWVNSDDPRSACRMKRQMRRLPEEMTLVLMVVRDLVNGSKHFQLDLQAASKRKITEVHSGDGVDYYEYYFQEDLPGVTLENGWYFSIRILHNLLMSYFDWIFDDSVAVESFPAELLDALQYCNIPNRRAGPSPRIWLLEIEAAFRSLQAPAM